MKNQFGKTSCCSLTAAFRDDKTVLEDVSFTAPFKIMTPFYEKPDFMHVMLLSASAGIMEGDTQEFQIHTKPNAHMRFSAQAYEKIHKMKDGYAKRNTRIQVEEGSVLDYYSQPVIPFAQSAFTSTLEAELADESAQFLYEEILSCGRTAYGEQFDYRFYHNLVSVKREGKLIYRDNTCFRPDLMDMQGIGMYEGFHHYGTLLIFNRELEREQIEEIRQVLEDDSQIQGGVTRISSRDTAVRVLGNRAQHLEELFKNIKTNYIA